MGEVESRGLVWCGENMLRPREAFGIDIGTLVAEDDPPEDGDMTVSDANDASDVSIPWILPPLPLP